MTPSTRHRGIARPNHRAQTSARTLCAVVFATLVAATFALWPAAAVASDTEFSDLEERGLIGIAQQLQDLQTLGRVLNLAAHPDDEDGATLAFARRAKGLRTFTAFANRGEGGQNEIGPELYRELGAIREVETRRAQAHVGSHPLFLGLEDFGYCKTAKEAFDRWGGEEYVTERVVYAYRIVRPDVVFTNHDPVTGHGQHRALSIAGRKAFEIAGDPDAYPEQGLPVWAPTLYLERVAAPKVAEPADEKPKATPAEAPTTPPSTDGDNEAESEPPDLRPRIRVPIEEIDPVRGTAYASQAHAALKEHKSQGRWLGRRRGDRWFAVQARRHPQFLPEGKHPFDPIALSRLRTFRAGAEEGIDDKLLAQVLRPTFLRPSLPAPSDRDALFDTLLIHRSALAKVTSKIDASDGHLKRDLRELLSITNRTLGMLLDVRARVVTEPSPPIAGEPTKLFLAIHAPPGIEVTHDGEAEADGSVRVPLDSRTFEEPATPLAFSPLYTAFDPAERHAVSAAHAVRDPRTERAVSIRANASIAPRAKISLDFSPRIRVLRTGSAGQDAGTSQQTARVILRVSTATALTEPLRLDIHDDQENVVQSLTVDSGSDGTVLLPVALNVPDAEGTTYFRVRTRGGPSSVQALSPLRVVVVRAKVADNLRVGVVRSYDDTLQGALADLGVAARPLSTDDLAFRNLDAFDAILIDIRAFLVRDDLQRFHPRLLEYARSGGVLGIFYQKTAEWNPKRNGGRVYAPFPLEITRSRVVDETAPVDLLLPDHPLLSWPNRIHQSDFDDWVHERGLYFPNQSYDPAYAELLSCHDVDEDPLKGGLLHAQVGKGHFVYTAYGWYRQWLAGQPGAYRFLGNLVSLGRADQP